MRRGRRRLGGEGVRPHDVLGELLVVLFVGSIQQDEDQVEPGQQGSAHLLRVFTEYQFAACATTHRESWGGSREEIWDGWRILEICSRIFQLDPVKPMEVKGRVHARARQKPRTFLFVSSSGCKEGDTVIISAGGGVGKKTSKI